MNLWDRRIARAHLLESQYPAAAELLGFYREIAAFQKQIWQAALPALPLSLHPGIPEPLRPYIQPLLALLQRVAPPELAAAAGPWPPAPGPHAFLTRVLLQPYAESLARRPIRAPDSSTAACPVCNELPVAAILRPEGEGGKRSLLCSLCFTEWDFRRLLCPSCGEEDHQKLPVYTAEPFPHVRIEACDTCRTYLKSIDLTRDGLAVPEVDEIAALPLDLWASSHDYSKLQSNLFGL